MHYGIRKGHKLNLKLKSSLPVNFVVGIQNELGGERMKVLKKIETDMWINVIMMFLIGVLFIVRPQNSLESVAIIAGIIIFVNGIFDLFYDIKIWTDFYIRYSLFEGIMKCILGIFIATHAGIITILFSYVFSIYIIINGIICMETAVYMRSIFKVNSGIYIVLSGLEVLGGIIMMFISPDTVKAAAILAGIIFILNAVIDSVILYRIHKIGRHCTEHIQDVVDELNGNIVDEDDVK